VIINITVMWEMRLCVTGETEKTKPAIDNLRSICDVYLKVLCLFEVIDLLKHPE
jgi:hypothetical protein